MESTDLIKNRRSVRGYTQDRIPLDVLDDVLECARLAPTARNVQPWKIIAVTDRRILEKLGETCSTGPFIANAAVCFTVFCLKDEKYHLEDGCAAVMNIIYACEIHGLGTCWVAGDKKPYANKVREILEVPDEYTLIALVPAGYPAEDAGDKPKKSVGEVCALK
ncbi:MAG: nitroreductase family protein [Candidatus Altiarchaeota archaeon]